MFKGDWDNPGQTLWNKVKKSNKIDRTKKLWYYALIYHGNVAKFQIPKSRIVWKAFFMLSTFLIIYEVSKNSLVLVQKWKFYQKNHNQP